MPALRRLILPALALALLSFASLASVAGCQALVDAKATQCERDDDCARRGLTAHHCAETVCVPNTVVTDAASDAPVDPKWGCLGKVTWGPPSETETIRWRERFQRFESTTAIQGLDVQACGRLSSAVDAGTTKCTKPLTSATSDAEGWVELRLPKGFDGFLALSAPPNFQDMMPGLFFIPPPQADVLPERVLGVSPPLASYVELNGLYYALGVKFEPTLGVLLTQTVDCTGKATAGVEIRSSVRGPDTHPYYDANGSPSITAQQTGERGEAGYLNMPPGVVEITANVPALGKKMAVYSVQVRAGSITYLNIAPSPLP